MTEAGEILARRVKALIGESNLRGAPLRIEKAAASRGLTVTHSTLQRILNGEGAHLDKIEDVAAYFRTDVWRLLCDEASAHQSPSMGQSIDVLASTLDQLTPEARETAAQQLQTLARAPDSAKAREAVLAFLSPIPPAPNVETMHFAGRPTGAPQHKTEAPTGAAKDFLKR